MQEDMPSPRKERVRDSPGAPGHVGAPHTVVITRLTLDKDHKKVLEWKTQSHQARKEMGKYKEETTEKMQE